MTPPSFTRVGTIVTLLDAAATNVVAVDDQGRIVYTNPRADALFGYAPGELLGTPVEVLVLDDDMAQHERDREREGPSLSARAHRAALGRHRDGSALHLEISLTPVVTGDGTWTVAGVVDISAQRVAEARILGLNRAYLTLARLNEAVVRASGPDDLFATTCRVAVEQGGYVAAWVAEPGEDGGVREVARAGTLDAYLDTLELTTDATDPRGRGPTARTLRDGVARYSADFLHDVTTAPWHAQANLHGVRASASIPLSRQGRVVAALNLYASEADVFGAPVRELLESVATNVSFALDAFEAQSRLARTAAHRSELLARLVAAQEQERVRIANEVHDESVQSMAALDLRLGMLRRRLVERAPDLVQGVDLLLEQTGAVSAGLRHLLFDLEPPREGTPLIELLREALGHTFAEHDVTWSVALAPPSGTVVRAARLHEHLAALPPAVRTQAARIAKEALTNVRKHARATRVEVRVVPDPTGVEVTVIDDGVGLRADRLRSRPGHRGLSAMRDRAEVAGGWCRLDSSSQGTSLTFWLPHLGHLADTPDTPEAAG